MAVVRRAMYRHATEDRFNFNGVAEPDSAFILNQDAASGSYAAYGEATRSMLDGRLEAMVGLRWLRIIRHRTERPSQRSSDSG